MLPLPASLNPHAAELRSQITEIPNRHGIYLLTPKQGVPYLGFAAFLQKRLTRLLFHNIQLSNPVANLRENLAKIEYWLTGSRLEMLLLLYWLAREHHPATYRKRLKLKDPSLLALLPGHGFARLAVRHRIPDESVAVYGPFPSREASERFQQGVLGLFRLRRCEENLQPSVHHPGCIYGEINACLRPCQEAVSSEEYSAETKRVGEFLEENGRSLLSVLTETRNAASEQMEFEEAARLHREVEKVKAVTTLRDSLATNVENLNGIAVARAARDETVALWPMVRGYWQAPLFVPVTLNVAEPVSSLDRQLRERLQEHLQTPQEDGERLEHIALLSRWYYASGRQEPWFSFQTLSDLNWRKLVREISAMARQPVQQES
jgi:excinuclease ABC subunit C